MKDEEKAEEIKYLRFATEENLTKRDLFKLALDRRCIINELLKENADLKAQIENYKLSENESKEIIAELKEIHESDKKSVGLIVKTAKDEIDKYKEQVDKIREWVKDHLYEDGCIDCDSIEVDKLLEILK